MASSFAVAPSLGDSTPADTAVPELELKIEHLSLASTPDARSTDSPAPSTALPESSDAPKPLIVAYSKPNPEDPEGFLYVPAGTNELVIIDELANLPHTASWPVWNVPPPPPPAEHCFYIKAVEGKGQGMFASRPIVKGELIIEERPLYVSRLQPDEASDGSFELAAIEHLAPSTREKFLSLSNAQDPHIHRLPGILLTNLFAIDFDYESSDEHLGGGVYEFICRANQNCIPSTYVSI